MRIHRQVLTTAKHVLVFPNDANVFVVELDSTGGAFTVTLPELYCNEHREIRFYNYLNGNTVTITSRSIDHGTDPVTLDAGDRATFVDSLKGTWLSRVSRNGTLWEDMNFAVVRSGGPAANRPNDVTINNVYYKEFTSLNNQTCGDSQEVPHKYKLNTVLYPHIHCFLKSGESEGTTGVTFTVYWELRNGAETLSGNFDISVTSAQLAANGNEIFAGYSNGIAGISRLGSQLTVSLSRTAGDAGDVIVVTYGFHYEIDYSGSMKVAEK